MRNSEYNRKRIQSQNKAANAQLLGLLTRQVKRVNRVGFYRCKLKRACINPLKINTFEDFKKIPFTTNTEFVEELKQEPGKCSLYPKNVTRINFSPTGKDLYPVFHTNKDLKIMNQVCARSLKDTGILKRDICAVAFGYNFSISGLFYQSQLEFYGAKVIPLDPDQTERAARIINDYKVSVLISDLPFAIKLATLGVQGIKILFVCADPFSYEDDYPVKIREIFQKKIIIIDSYNIVECSPVACGCRYETGLHIIDDFVYAEIIDPETGKNVLPGEKGELVLTHLYKEAAPLLRYRTGNLTYMENNYCKCGRQFTLVRPSR